MENETNRDFLKSYDNFKNKLVKIVLTFGDGKAITYRGQIIQENPDSILFHDRMLGEMIIGKKDISQVLVVSQ